MAEDGQPFSVLVGDHAPAHLAQRARALGLTVAHTDADSSASVCLALVGNASEADAVRAVHPLALIVGWRTDAASCDLMLPGDAKGLAIDQMLRHALTLAMLRRSHQLESAGQRGRLRLMTEMAQALAAERDPARLLDRILSEGRRLARCEGGSLYLIDVDNAVPCLTFKLVQNDVVQTTFEEKRLHITAASLAGYVALTGAELNIRDAYAIPAELPYRFNADFDLSTGYRSKSVLVMPMRDHRGVVVGVLQFINRRVGDVVCDFDEETVELLRAVGGQAAIAIQKNRLIGSIRELFEQFVHASVKAIERRDPTTSGHSFRVAQTTTALFAALPQSGLARFRKLELSDESMTEIRYAALLHDFGKIGVREAVLVKPHKLAQDRLEIIRYRFALQKERARSAALQEELELLHHGADDFDQRKREIRARLVREEARLSRYLEALISANDPRVSASGNFEFLREIASVPFGELDGSRGGLLTAADAEALAVRRGSLTDSERREIQQHVSYTRDFLAVLPWPAELARVPLIAAAHHEKLNGSGYPLGLVGDQIPLPSRVMTVCDIYDALTAMDRPYKSALSHDSAVAILDDEVRAGMLDADIVSVFIGSRAYQASA